MDIKDVNVNLVTQVSLKLHSLFSTDQNHYAIQTNDGNYPKMAGKINPIIIEQNIKSGGALAVYQKNKDTSIKWICYDFDILKKNIESNNSEAAKKELIESVLFFTRALRELDIPFSVEHSGNRGVHIWIIISEKISYTTGYS